ncbi:MAG: aminobutyraldehyde dehydrogenase [Synechococcaceae cyanobacterium RM1_1_27]|nr:aminobutyraldehyde dehydrogenase [Synechococcaceae cyanobacterium RM1_1_27]
MHTKLWINGEWVDSADRLSPLAVENPATGSLLAEVVCASPGDVDRAVQAAVVAFEDGRWSRLTPADRSKALWKLADLLEAKIHDFARVESENTGKPYEAVSLGGDLPFTIDNLRFFAAAARQAQGQGMGEYVAGYTSLHRRDPVGVCAQITPWNFPLMMAVWKIAPALAAGCTVVLKPAPQTPLTTLMLAELTAEAGIPPGVVNVLTGDNQTGQALVEHPDIRLVSLTGSTATGKTIMRTAADSLKRVHLELGGKAPFIVLADADLETVAEEAAAAATFNSGQDCTAATRIYVPQAQLKEFAAAVVEQMQAIRVGSPFDPEVEMGPLVSKVHRDRVQGYVERASAAGARILTGGGIPLEQGYFFAPTVIADAAHDSQIVQQEVFGPVITLHGYETEAEALHLSNDVVYGLAASVWTQDLDRALQFSRDLEFGTVWINTHLTLASEAPHGGFKQSGFGNDLSAESLADYQVSKHVMIAHQQD